MSAILPPEPCETCACGAVSAAETHSLLRHGITRVPAAIYLVGGYRYSSLPDAVAQSRRLARAEAYFAN